MGLHFAGRARYMAIELLGSTRGGWDEAKMAEFLHLGDSRER